LNIDTATIQRLRDALLENGSPRPDEPATEQAEADSTLARAALRRFAPFAETMYLMMMVDGDQNTSELDSIRGAMRILTNECLGDDALDDIFRRCGLNVAEFGVNHCLRDIGARLSADRLDRETAFTLAAAVALADRQLLKQESSLMHSIAEWYGISGKRALQLLQQV
jgi:hypothetical protein